MLIIITVDNKGVIEDHPYPIDNRKEGIAIVERQRANAVKVDRYIFTH